MLLKDVYYFVEELHFNLDTDYKYFMKQDNNSTILSRSPPPLSLLFPPDAYCSVSGTLHPQVLQFHSQCLSLCGDIQLMLAQNANNRAAYLEEYSYQTKEDQEILHSLHRESSCQGQSLKRDNHTSPKAHNVPMSCLITNITGLQCLLFQCSLYPINFYNFSSFLVVLLNY